VSVPPFDLSRVGAVTEPVEYWVDRARLQAYARAIGDDDTRHRSGDGANPVFHVVPATPAVGQALAGVVTAAGQGLLGEIDVRSHRSPHPDAAVSTTASIVSIRNRSTGVVVSAYARSESAGELCAEQYISLFYRGVQAEADVGTPVTLPAAPATDDTPDVGVETVFPADVTYRYSGVVGDRTAVHLDSRAARAVGIPGIILHGTCTLAMVLESVCAAEGAESEAVRRVAARLDQWVTPSDRVTTDVFHEDGRRVRFAARRQDGAAVLSRGVVEFA